ncbi:hypothetical protein L1280_001987 [Deinococcus sp. HSC-46F16]|uniref:hypothetical protein n=1 Tax=Deinococcus sp. HSC-46F16 TaxID=2910968 RepID=UPI00209F377A|nr:hypothetical protein [Deinococcus sp. HSC-46F16]MCP2014835.1 hypothetical protein [Deinococcus sp. HSC-46F16]
MSGFSGGSFSFGRSHSHSHGRRGFGMLGHSHSSGHRRGGFLGGLTSHSSGHRGRYVGGGHYRQARRPRGLGCLGAFMVGAALTGGTLAGVLSLLA